MLLTYFMTWLLWPKFPMCVNWHHSIEIRLYNIFLEAWRDPIAFHKQVGKLWILDVAALWRRAGWDFLEYVFFAYSVQSKYGNISLSTQCLLGKVISSRMEFLPVAIHLLGKCPSYHIADYCKISLSLTLWSFMEAFTKGLVRRYSAQM